MINATSQSPTNWTPIAKSYYPIHTHTVSLSLPVSSSSACVYVACPVFELIVAVLCVPLVCGGLVVAAGGSQVRHDGLQSRIFLD
jgi:hypothetical protein